MFTPRAAYTASNNQLVFDVLRIDNAPVNIGIREGLNYLLIEHTENEDIVLVPSDEITTLARMVLSLFHAHVQIFDVANDNGHDLEKDDIDEIVKTDPEFAALHNQLTQEEIVFSVSLDSDVGEATHIVITDLEEQDASVIISLEKAEAFATALLVLNKNIGAYERNTA